MHLARGSGHTVYGWLSLRWKHHGRGDWCRRAAGFMTIRKQREKAGARGGDEPFTGWRCKPV